MRKISPWLIIIALSFNSLVAQSLTSRPVGPGINHHHAYLPGGPWHIQILEIDLSDTMNTLETVKAFNAIEGYERTSSMANRSNREGHTVIGAINGDFYASGGITIGAQIIKGTLLKRPYPRSVFALTASKQPFINVVDYYGQVVKNNSMVFSINGVNETRQENQLIVYNNYFGASTGTNQWGTEISVQYLQSPPGINAPQYAVVTSKDSLMGAESGNMQIPTNMGAILSGHGFARDFLNDSVFVGDTVAIQLLLHPADNNILQELIGGTPRIIRGGVSSVEWEAESVGSSFAHDRHPRTAVGFNADSTVVYFFTVDGRQGGYSVGMSLFELADYMLEWGVYQGVNLDGGGSTTMVVRGDVVSSPSDAGGERSVANALMAISKAPLGPLAYLNLPWDETFALVESQIQFNVTGTDSYYNPIPVDGDSILWSCDELIGTISESGLFSASGTESSGLVIAQHGAINDTMLVHVTDIDSIILTPNQVILEIGSIQLMSTQARDSFGNLIQVDYDSYSWWVTPDIATISSDGAVHALHAGSGSIEASYHGVSASVPLLVGSSTSVILDNFNTSSNFTLSGAVINLSACSFVADTEQFVSTPSSGKLNYSLATGGTSVLYMNCNIPISGTPESVSIQVYGDNSAHWIRGEFKNSNKEKFILNITDASPGINWDNEWREITVMLTEAAPHWGNPSAILSFPITWTKIYLAETDDNNKDSGSIYFDDFRINFISSEIKDTPKVSPKMFHLEDHFPNPFNSSMSFRFSIQEPGILELRLYALDGREVDSLKQDARPGSLILNWEAKNLPSGVYVFKATLGSQELSGKCLLVK
ncbi:MAG: phosphodiester glycosidase family protein [Candidatus Marinimicrobia bacterium]|nr:phosphodiester glycosidase family protein [Candidatus Neomarinimicrobiota bacterium]